MFTENNIEKNKLLSPFTTMQMGGTADYYYKVTDTNDLPELIEYCKRNTLNYIILGGGSNIIFSENGFRGLVIHIQANHFEIKGNQVTAQAGALVSQIIQQTLKNNLSGLEKLTGLPGTIGGAVRGNAGAYGIEISNYLTKAKVYTPEEEIKNVDKDYFQFGYRHSKIKNNNDIILEVTLELIPKENCEEEQKAATEIIKSRVGKQPSGKTCGSFFKNPTPATAAGLLLDQCGAKSLQYGDAKVSDLHANWIINAGTATQTELIKLAQEMQEKVQEKFNIELTPEVQLIGEQGFLEKLRP